MSQTLGQEGGGGQGIPMSSSSPGYLPQGQQGPSPPVQSATSTTTTNMPGGGQSGYQPQQQPPQQFYQGQQQYYPQQQQQYGQQQGMQVQMPNLMSKHPEAPALAVAIQQPEEPTPIEGFNCFLAVFIPLCALASMILLAIAGSTTIPVGSEWRLSISATIITAVGVVLFTVLKRMFANESQQEAENALGIAVLAHANIRAVAVRALAAQHREIKVAEGLVRDTEVILILLVALPASILSGISSVFAGLVSVSIIAAYLNAVAAALSVMYEAKANALRISAQRLEEQLKRNSLVAEFLRADASKKHSLLQDRVEALTMA